MSLFPCPGTAAVTCHHSAVCTIHDTSKTFPTSARIIFGSVSSEEAHFPVVLFHFGRKLSGGWKDDVPRLQLTLDPTSVRELRVDTDGVMHVDALVDSVSESEFSPLSIRLEAGVESNPSHEEWIEASKATALDFMSFWQEEAAEAAAAASEKLRHNAKAAIAAAKLLHAKARPSPSAAAAAALSSAEAARSEETPASPVPAKDGSSPPAADALAKEEPGNDEAAGEEEEGDDVATQLPSEMGDFLKRGADNSAASVGTSASGPRSTSSRMLKMKEVQEAALGLSCILSNVNVNKEARNGLSRRQFRRQLLQDQLSALAESVSGTSVDDGSASVRSSGAPQAPPMARQAAPPRYGSQRGPAAYSAPAHRGGGGPYYGNGYAPQQAYGMPPMPGPHGGYYAPAMPPHPHAYGPGAYIPTYYMQQPPQQQQAMGGEEAYGTADSSSNWRPAPAAPYRK